MPEEVVPRPEIDIGDLIRHKLFHRRSELLVLLQVLGNVFRLRFDRKALLPPSVLGASWVSHEAVTAGVDDMQLGVEASCVDDSLSILAFALEHDSALAICFVTLIRWGDRDSVTQEIADVGAELEEGLISGLFSFFDLLQTFRCLAPEA